MGKNEATRAVLAQVARVAEERVSWEVAVAEAESRQYSERNGHVPVDERDADYFNNIEQHQEINVVQVMKSAVPRTHNGGIDAKAILAAVRNNPATDEVDGSYAAYCYDIDAYVELTNDGVTHNFRRSAGRNEKVKPSATTLHNANAAVLLPQLLANAVEVNRSTKYKTENRPYGHVMVAVFSETDAHGNTEYYAVRMVIEHNVSKKGYKLYEYGVIGRIHSTNAKKMHPLNISVSTDSASRPVPASTSTISIADVIQSVKTEFDDTFAEGVYRKLGMKRRESDFSQYLQFSERPQTETDAFKRWFGNSVVVNADGSPKVMYHGTPYGGFTVFKEWQYFTEDDAYADRYHNPSASSIRGRYSPATNPQTYAVYLSVKKPFDTRIPEIREIWENEFYGSYSRTPLSDRGLPDWTDGIDLIEFIEENDYDYDGIILDEGATGGYGEAVVDRGLSVVVRSAGQIKSATDNEGSFDPENPDIRYSERRPTAPSLRETLHEAIVAKNRALPLFKPGRPRAVSAATTETP